MYILEQLRQGYIIYTIGIYVKYHMQDSFLPVHLLDWIFNGRNENLG